jgi:hypothetical protein
MRWNMANTLLARFAHAVEEISLLLEESRRKAQHAEEKARNLINCRGSRQQQLARAREDIQRLEMSKVMGEYNRAKRVDLVPTLHPSCVMHEILDAAISAYMTRIAKAREKVRRVAAQFSYEYATESGWVAMTDPVATAAYDSLSRRERSKVVSFNDRAYAIEMDETEGNVIGSVAGACDGAAASVALDSRYWQINQHTGTKRLVRARRNVAESLEPQDLSQADRFEMLFGPESPVEISEEQIARWRYLVLDDRPPTASFSRKLSELAELFGEISGVGSRYIVKAGTRPTGADLLPFESNTDGAHDFNCELWTKPNGLARFVGELMSSSYRHARIVCHGSTMDGYESLRTDKIGFGTEQQSDSTAQAYGPGIYCGLSHHASDSRNRGSDLPDGSYCMSLLLTRDAESWQRCHTGYRTMPMGEDELTAYETLTSQDIECLTQVDSAVVVHKESLLLCLGLVRAFDAKDGWKRGTP